MGTIDFGVKTETSGIALLQEEFICEIPGDRLTRTATFYAEQPEDGGVEVFIHDDDHQGVTIVLNPDGTWLAYPTGG